MNQQLIRCSITHFHVLPGIFSCLKWTFFTEPEGVTWALSSGESFFSFFLCWLIKWAFAYFSSCVHSPAMFYFGLADSDDLKLNKHRQDGFFCSRPIRSRPVRSVTLFLHFASFWCFSQFLGEHLCHSNILRWWKLDFTGSRSQQHCAASMMCSVRCWLVWDQTASVFTWDLETPKITQGSRLLISSTDQFVVLDP